jgi:CsoR family transcriptional regulator, copper-sensing transcriptional repressor
MKGQDRMARKKIRSGKLQLLQRLRRIEGQAAALVRMADEDAYCIDLLTQIAAARAALLAVGKIILHDHMQSCVTESITTPAHAAEAIGELETVLSRFVK